MIDFAHLDDRANQLRAADPFVHHLRRHPDHLETGPDARAIQIRQRDIVVMQDVVLFFASLVIIMNFLVDLSFLVIDPRLRSGGAR